MLPSMRLSNSAFRKGDSGLPLAGHDQVTLAINACSSKLSTNDKNDKQKTKNRTGAISGQGTFLDLVDLVCCPVCKVKIILN